MDKTGNDKQTANEESSLIFRLLRSPGQWPATFRALRHRNFQLFWSGQLVSLIGTWMQSTAQGWLVYRLALHDYGLSATSFYLGLISALGSLPILVFTLFAGALADRTDKRRIIIATQISSMLLALAFAVLDSTGHIRLWHVAVLATSLGLVNAFDMPTRQAFVKDMVGPQDLLNAIALNSSIFNGARIIGPAVAGLLVALPGIGMAGVFYLNGISYLAVIAGLLAIRIPAYPSAVSQSNIWEHMREGLSYVIHQKTLRLILLIMGVFSIFGFSYIVLMPIIAGSILHAQAQHYGILLAFGGAGALIGTLILATMAGRVCKGKVLQLGSILFSLGLILFSLSHLYWLSAVLLMFVSGGLVVASASINSIIQEIAPDHLRGRIVSIWALIFAGSTPIGAFYAGMLARYTTPTMPLLVGGLICLLTVGILYLRIPWIWQLE